MAEEELEIEINAQGQVTVRPKGVKGKRCTDYANLFAQIVGREISREKTAEFYDATGETQRHIDVKQQR
jgi:streptomycin 6-kinase